MTPVRVRRLDRDIELLTPVLGSSGQPRSVSNRDFAYVEVLLC